MSNAEFGSEMAQICIKENQAVRAEVARYPDEVKDIVARCSRRKEMGWGFVKKCIDLCEILKVRHCVFIIGPPGCGKTSVWRTLLQTHIANKEDG